MPTPSGNRSDRLMSVVYCGADADALFDTDVAMKTANIVDKLPKNANLVLRYF